jgi:hypothetical protein
MQRQIISRTVRGSVLAIALGGLAACDFKVTNPGPILDQYLSDTVAFKSEVNGIGFTLGDGMNYLVLQGAVAARELFPTGTSGQFGIEPRNWVGYLLTEEQGSVWSSLQQSRWLGDAVVARMQASYGDARFAKHPLAAQALVYRGFAYRVIGESMCYSVINSGPLKPAVEDLQRSESTFTAAIAVATAANSTTLLNAAYAGRAQARMLQGNWDGAKADAGLVATSFTYQMPYYATGDAPGYNRTYWSATTEGLYKSHSVWNTWYAKYYDSSNDPRVKYTKTTSTGSGAFPPVGKVPWWVQAKYTNRAAGVNLASGREMRLIEAEAALKSGDLATAVARINTVRALANVTPIAPANITDGWTLLKRERGIELWLEGRRIGDFRRWAAAATPGELDPLEKVGAASYLEALNTCFPLSQSEINTNPNAKP